MKVVCLKLEHVINPIYTHKSKCKHFLKLDVILFTRIGEIDLNKI